MRILMHPRAITATDKELRVQIREAMEATFLPVLPQLQWVDVYVTDVNGPRGGVDKRCRVVAHLKSGMVVVSRMGTDLMSAVTASAIRCRRMIRTRVKRRRDRRRRAEV